LHHTHRYRLRVIRLLQIGCASFLLASFLALIPQSNVHAATFIYAAVVHAFSVTLSACCIAIEHWMDHITVFRRTWRRRAQNMWLSLTRRPRVQGQHQGESTRDLIRPEDIERPSSLVSSTLPSVPSPDTPPPPAVSAVGVDREAERAVARRKTNGLLLTTWCTGLQLGLVLSVFTFLLTQVSCPFDGDSGSTTVGCRAWVNTLRAVTWVHAFLWMLAFGFCIERYQNWVWLCQSMERHMERSSLYSSPQASG
jgi:hypothetical protein